MRNLFFAFFFIFLNCRVSAASENRDLNHREGFNPKSINTAITGNQVQTFSLPQLGTAANFALFTSSGAIGNTAASSIIGDIGSNAGAISGFGTSSQTGGTYNNNSVTTNCAVDLLAAYNQFYAIAPTASHAAAFGGGETLNTGVYSVGGAGSVAGALTLDAQGDQNAVFIFKINGAFTTGAGTTVTLINGATANNVFWIVEGAIVMAASTSMKGTLIANNGAVSMGVSGTLEGRMLSTTGAVATYADNIYLPIFIWIGSVSNNWNTAANWFNNSVPTINNQSVVGICRPFNSPPVIPASAGIVNIGSITFGTVGGQASGVVINANSTLNVTGTIFYQSDPGSALGYTCLLSGSGILNAKSIAINSNTATAGQSYNQILSSSVNNLNISTDLTLTSTAISASVFNATFNLIGGIALLNGKIQTNNNTGNTSTFAVTSSLATTLQLSGGNALSALSTIGSNIINLKNSGVTIEYTGGAQTVYTDASLPGLTTGIIYQNIKFSGTGIKTVTSGNLNITGNFTNTLINDNADYVDFSLPAVNFTGTGQILTGGTGYGTKFYATNFSGGGADTLSTGLFSIASAGVLTLSGNTTLATGNGRITLNSDISGSASVAAIPPGSSITGIVKVQRFITGGSLTYRGYRTLSSPVTDPTSPGSTPSYNLTFLSGSGTYLSGVSGGGFDVTGNPTIYLYNESVTPNNTSLTSGNFRAITAINRSPAYNIGTIDGNFNLSVGNGIFLFFRGNNGTNPATIPNNITFTMTGALNQGQYTVNDWYTATPTSQLGITGTGTGTNYAIRGFNLVGNPYASSIDWNTMYGNGNTISGICCAANISNSIYVYNVTSKNYSIYTNTSSGSGTATGSTGGSNIIPSGQGFLVLATGTGATLIFNENAKVSTQPAITLLNAWTAPVADRHLRLQLFKDSINKDETVIIFNALASATYSEQEDGLYLQGTGQVNLSNMTSDKKAVGLNQEPFPTKPQTIGLNVIATSDGVYQLKMIDIANIPNYFDILLKDAYLKDSIDIKHNPVYSFSLLHSDTASISLKRFSLLIRPNLAYAYQLLFFGGTKTNNGAQLTWTTLNEDIYTGFEVQRSTVGGKNFITLATIMSNASGAYSYLDIKPVTGEDQYRLQQTDLNGIVTYSNVVLLLYAPTGGTIPAIGNISIYPNPVKDVINVTVTSTNSVAATYRINITATNGDMMKTFLQPQLTGQSNLSKLGPGVYIISVINNTDKTVVGTKKFIKL